MLVEGCNLMSDVDLISGLRYFRDPLYLLDVDSWIVDDSKRTGGTCYGRNALLVFDSQLHICFILCLGSQGKGSRKNRKIAL